MKTFVDATGKTWTVTINTSAVKRPKETAGVYLVDTPVKLNVLREDHAFADVVDDGRLSSAPEGPAQILWKEEGTGEDKWALVRVAEALPQAPFWAEITADGGGAYEWVEVEWTGAGGSQHKTGGRSSDEYGPAYEVNDFDFGASDINPVGQVIQLFRTNRPRRPSHRAARAGCGPRSPLSRRLRYTYAGSHILLPSATARSRLARAKPTASGRATRRASERSGV